MINESFNRTSIQLVGEVSERTSAPLWEWNLHQNDVVGKRFCSKSDINSIPTPLCCAKYGNQRCFHIKTKIPPSSACGGRVAASAVRMRREKIIPKRKIDWRLWYEFVAFRQIFSPHWENKHEIVFTGKSAEAVGWGRSFKGVSDHVEKG